MRKAMIKTNKNLTLKTFRQQLLEAVPLDTVSKEGLSKIESVISSAILAEVDYAYIQFLNEVFDWMTNECTEEEWGSKFMTLQEHLAILPREYSDDDFRQSESFLQTIRGIHKPRKELLAHVVRAYVQLKKQVYQIVPDFFANFFQEFDASQEKLSFESCWFFASKVQSLVGGLEFLNEDGFYIFPTLLDSSILDADVYAEGLSTVKKMNAYQGYYKERKKMDCKEKMKRSLNKIDK